MSSIKAFIVGLAGLLVVAWAFIAHAAEDHRQYVDSKPQECSDCHRSSGVMENHGAFFLRDHRLLAQKTPKNCGDCHQASFCSDCHRGGNLEHDLGKSMSRRGEQMPETHAPASSTRTASRHTTIRSPVPAAMTRGGSAPTATTARAARTSSRSGRTPRRSPAGCRIRSG